VANKNNGLARGEKFLAGPRPAQEAIGIMTISGYRGDMIVTITTSGPRQYVKLVESHRDTSGVRRQRVIATLGRIEAVRSGEADSLLNGLLRALGKPSLEEGTGEVAFAPVFSVGDTWLRTALWKELGFADAFRRLLRNRHQFDATRRLRKRSHLLKKSCQPDDLYGIVAELADDLTDATRCT